jgi:hypothetical protein
VHQSTALLLAQFGAALAKAFRADCGLAPVALICGMFYDETPLSIRVERKPLSPGGVHIGPRDARRPTVSKVLQSDAFIVAVIRHGSVFFSCRVNLPSPLQVMDHGTAENLKSCMDHIWSAYPAVKGLKEVFPAVIYSSTHDRGSCNLKYEACELRSAAPHEGRISMHCDAHKVTNVAGSQYEQAPRPISGAISFANSQRPAGSLDTLRCCLLMFLKTRCKVRVGLSSEAASQHRDAICRMCTAVSAERKCVLRTWFNGDWTKDDPEHYHGPRCACGNLEPQDFPPFMENHLVPALLPGLTPLFP